MSRTSSGLASEPKLSIHGEDRPAAASALLRGLLPARGARSTSLPARPPGERRRSRSGCAAGGDARCRGRAWRAGSGRGSVCAPPPPQSRLLPGSSPRLSPTLGRSAPHDAALQGPWEPSKSGSCCGLRGGGTAPVPPLRHPCLPSPGSWGTLRSPRKAARWRAVSRVEGPGWVPAGWAAVQRPGPESPKAARHGPGLTVAAASSSWSPGDRPPSSLTPPPLSFEGEGQAPGLFGEEEGGLSGPCDPVSS